MCNILDPEWNKGSEQVAVGTNDGPERKSNNKLSVKLANPSGHWLYYPSPEYGGTPSSTSVENTPGYNYSNNIEDPDANASGFNALPTGYWKQGNFYTNGAMNMWVAISQSATSSSNVVKITRENTGILHQGWSSTGQEGYSVRCVKDAE
jgi:hypothetical protein